MREPNALSKVSRKELGGQTNLAWAFKAQPEGAGPTGIYKRVSKVSSMISVDVWTDRYGTGDRRRLSRNL